MGGDLLKKEGKQLELYQVGNAYFDVDGHHNKRRSKST
jgi:hypothetical protein